MATSVPMGIVSLKAEGAYAADKLYKKGMWVTSSGSSYAYINPTPNTNVPLTDTSHWQQIAEKGDKGDTGDVTSEAEAARDAAEGFADAAQGSKNYVASVEGKLLDRRADIGLTKNVNAIAGLVTIVDDDGKVNAYNTTYPIFQSAGVKGVFAITTGLIGSSGAMSKAQIDEVYAAGHEIASHGVEHVWATTDLTQIKNSYDALTFLGYDVRSMVYVGGNYNAEVIAETRRYYDCGVGVDGRFNRPPLATYHLYRVPLGSGPGSYTTIEGIEYTGTLANLKQYVDKAFAENAWLIFMLHSGFVEYTTERAQDVADLIEYIKGKSMPIVTLKEGMKLAGNLVDIGNINSPNRFIVGRDGNIYSGTLQDLTVYNSPPDANLNTLMTDFPLNKISVHTVTGHGLLITYRVGSYAFWKQFYYSPYNDVVQTRRWNYDASEWREWVRTASEGYVDNKPFKVLAINSISYDTLAPGYPSGLTIMPSNTLWNANIFGLVFTWNVNGNGWARQEVRQHGSDKIYVRTTDSNGAWKPFVCIVANAGTTANRPLNDPLGHSYYDTTLNKPVWVKTAGMREKDTLTITAGANSSGDITITLNGVAATVSVAGGDTVAQIDAKIRAAAYAGWGVSGTAGSGVAVFTRDNAGTALAPEFSAASTGVEGSISRTTNGGNAVWVDATGATI